MTARNFSFDPQRYARICGALYLYIITAGLFAEIVVRSRLVVPGDAQATARNIVANEVLFRIGFSGELLHLALDVAVAALLYALLRPVHPYVALLAAFMRVACDVVLAMASIGHFAALRLVAKPDYLKIPAEQQESLALLALRLHGDGYSISLVFFGFACLALGHLIVESRFLPRAIGVLMVIAGACYLVNSFAHFLAPALGAKLFPALVLPIFVAEFSLCVWLLVRGIDMAAWEKWTSAPRPSSAALS